MGSTVSFPRCGLRAGRAETLVYRMLGAVSPYYRGRATLQSCPTILAQALRRCVQTRDGRLLFLKNPKAACSTVVQLIHVHENGRFADVGRLHRTRGVRQGIRHAAAHIAAIDDPTCVRFTAVRDPASRVVSGFMMFFSGASAEVFKKEGRDRKARRSNKLEDLPRARCRPFTAPATQPGRAQVPRAASPPRSTW